MNLAELIVFSLFGLLLLITTAIIWFVFRKRKKWAVAITALFLLGYIGYYVYYPVLKASQHAEKYDQITEYLLSNYPQREFNVQPENLESGGDIGMFNVNDKETPDMGVTLYVEDNGQASQMSNWINSDIPQQTEIWRELKFYYGGNYTLDRNDFEITKQDEWIDKELTVFALNIDGRPAIAIYEYSAAGYGMLDLQEAEAKTYVAAEAEGRTFVFISEQYEEESVEINFADGTLMEVDAANNKGKLFIAE